MLNFSRFENATSCSPHEAKRNAGFWGAMQPCGERRSRIPLCFIRATLRDSFGHVISDLSENWKPDRFGFEALGCTHEIRFPVVKLLELSSRIENLGSNPNPFALVTAAHLQTKQTKRNSQARYRAKSALVRLLYQHGWSRQRVLDFFAVLDWMMRLPNPSLTWGKK